MEVMKPDIVLVGNRCYRKNPCRNDYGFQRIRCGQGSQESGYGDRFGTSLQSGSSSHVESAPGPYVEPDDEDSNWEPDATAAEEVEFNIEKLAAGAGFKSKCENIPSSLFSVIIGMKGATKKRIEAETNTKIIVPRMNEAGFIVVRGQRHQDVSSALRRIDMITKQARFRRDPTHFAAFPLNFQHLVQKFREFKGNVLGDFNGVGGINETLFIEPEKLHLTLCVLVLLEPKERKIAQEILEILSPLVNELTSKGKLAFRLQGLEIMNDDSTEVNVLYAKCNWTDPTPQKLADFIAAKFVESGLAKPNRSGCTVKLHATLMNSRYRQRLEADDNSNNSNSFRPTQSSKDYFDARNILKKYGDFDFGAAEIKEIHLSTMHSAGPDGFYKSLAKIAL